MGAERSNTTYYNDTTTGSLAASGVVADLAAVSIRYAGFVSIQCIIDDGAGGAPSDTPAGVFEAYSSSDGVTYSKVEAADTELTNIAPNGNNVVNAFAIFEGMPGTSLKIRYNRTSGGAGDSRLKMFITTW